MNRVLDFPEQRSIELEAAQWLVILDRDSPPSIEERRQLQKWLAKSAMHREALTSLADLWGQMNVLTQLAVESESPKKAPSTFWGFSQWSPPAMALAASLVLMLGLGWFVNNPSSAPAENVYYATAIGEQSEELLADGSVAFLNTDSQIEVDFNEEYRDVYLIQGEAYFVVEDNAERPLRVFANDTSIHALGTAFAVHIARQGVEVLVTDGLVSLNTLVPTTSENSSKVAADSPVLELGQLEAGHYATIRHNSSLAGSGIGDTSVIDSPQNRLGEIQDLGVEAINDRLSWRQGWLTLSGQRLDNVIQHMSRYTPVEIELANESVGSMRVGGRVPIGDADKVVEALDSIFGLEVTWLDRNHVLVSDRESL